MRLHALIAFVLIAVACVVAQDAQFADEAVLARRNAGGAPSYDTDAQDFFDRVATNGGTISTGTKSAVNTFVLAAKANGYWSDLSFVALFCGDQLAAALTPLKVGPASDPLSNPSSVFVGGDYSESTGLTGDGSSKYLMTGILASDLTGGNLHVSVYGASMTNVGNTQRQLFGGTGAASAYNGVQMFSWINNTNGRRFYADNAANSSGAAQAQTITGQLTDAYLIGNQSSTTDTRLYQNATEVATGASTTTTTFTGVELAAFANNFNGTINSYSGASIRGITCGVALSTDDITALNTDMEAFQDALSRGVQ